MTRTCNAVTYWFYRNDQHQCHSMNITFCVLVVQSKSLERWQPRIWHTPTLILMFRVKSVSLLVYFMTDIWRQAIDFKGVIQTEHINAFCVFSRCVQVHGTLKILKHCPSNSYPIFWRIAKLQYYTRRCVIWKCIEIQNYDIIEKSAV